MELKLTTDIEKAIKWFSKLHFKNSRCADGRHLIDMFTQEILYEKPSYIGTSVSDLSKIQMMRFHYEAIHKNFEGRYNVIYTDTGLRYQAS